MTLTPPDRAPQWAQPIPTDPQRSPGALGRAVVLRPRQGSQRPRTPEGSSPWLGAGSEPALPKQHALDQAEYAARQLLAWVQQEQGATVGWIDAHHERLSLPAQVERLVLAQAQAVILPDNASDPRAFRELLEAIHRGLPQCWIIVAREEGLLGAAPEELGPYHFLLTGETGPALRRLLENLAAGATEHGQIPGLTWRDAHGTLRSNPAWHRGSELTEGPYPNWTAGRARGATHFALRTARVCLPDCPTCHGAFGRTLRRREVSAVCAEIDWLLRDQGARTITLLDEVFDYEPTRAKRILRHLVQRQTELGIEVDLRIAQGLRGDRIDLELAALLRQAGLRTVDIVIGSASPRIQQELGRNLDLPNLERGLQWLAQQGIRLRGCFAFGYEREDPRERERSIVFARRSALHSVKFEAVGPKRHGNRWSDRTWAGLRFYAGKRRSDAWGAWATDRNETTWRPAAGRWLTRAELWWHKVRTSLERKRTSTPS